MTIYFCLTWVPLCEIYFQIFKSKPQFDFLISKSLKIFIIPPNYPIIVHQSEDKN